MAEDHTFTLTYNADSKIFSLSHRETGAYLYIHYNVKSALWSMTPSSHAVPAAQATEFSKIMSLARDRLDEMVKEKLDYQEKARQNIISTRNLLRSLKENPGQVQFIGDPDEFGQMPRFL